MMLTRLVVEELAQLYNQKCETVRGRRLIGDFPKGLVSFRSGRILEEAMLELW